MTRTGGRAAVRRRDMSSGGGHRLGTLTRHGSVVGARGHDASAAVPTSDARRDRSPGTGPAHAR